MAGSRRRDAVASSGTATAVTRGEKISVTPASMRLDVLATASLAVAQGLDIEETLASIVEAARTATGARSGALGILGADRRIARFISSGMTEQEREATGAYPTGRGILGILVDREEPLRLVDLTQDPRSNGFPPGHPPMHTFLGAPVVSRGQVFGNIFLTEKGNGEPFSAEDEHVLTLLAAQSGVAIANARLHEELTARVTQDQRSADTRARVVSAARGLLGESNLQKLMTSLAEQACEVVDAARIAIGIPNEATSVIRIAAATGENSADLVGLEAPMEGSLAGTSYLTGEQVRADNRSTLREFGAPTTSSIDSSIVFGVPVIGVAGPLAVLIAFDKRGAGPFTDEDADTLAILASLGAAAIETASAFRRERARADAFTRLREQKALEVSHNELRDQALSIQELERRRFAQDLHDRTAGMLMAGLLGIKRHRRAIDRRVDHAALSVEAEELRRLLAETLDDLRELINDLSPRVLEDFGLIVALEELCETTCRRSNLPVQLSAGAGMPAMTSALSTTAYRIVQEALTNVVRHAAASAARVSISSSDGLITIIVEDDGSGVGSGKPNLGISGMRERAEHIGGTLEIGAHSDGTGTRIVFSAPL